MPEKKTQTAAEKAAAEKAAEVTPVVAEVKKDSAKEETVKVKAVKTWTSNYGNKDYNIVAGKTYELPKTLASMLSKVGKVII